MKKAIAYDIFIYVLSLLIVGLVLYYGYRAVAGFGEKEKQFEFIKFKSDFENAVNTIAPDFGTVRMTSINVPVSLQKVCIVDPDKIGNPPLQLEAQKAEYPIIYDSVSTGAEKNIFPMPDGEPFYIKKIHLETGFECFPVAQSKIRIRLEGLGDKAAISSS